MLYYEVACLVLVFQSCLAVSLCYEVIKACMSVINFGNISILVAVD